MDIFDKIGKTELSNKSVIVYDKGQFLHVARRLGRDFGNVYYYLADEKPYPTKQIDDIGRGFPEIQVVDNFWETLGKADMVCFPDVYNGGLPEYLHRQGKPVFAALRSEQFEVDRKKLIKMLHLAKLPVSPSITKIGLTATQDYLKDKTDKFLKTGFYRGDMETYHYKNAFLASAWFKTKKSVLGTAAETIEIIIEEPIDSECESGFDGFMLNGELADNIMVGYEDKGKAYAACVVDKLPSSLSRMHDQMKPAFRSYGYQGAYSCEARIDKDGKMYYIDGTCRFGSPPSEVQCELYDSYSTDIWRLAHGQMPNPKPAKKYGVQLNLSSHWYEHYTLPVQVPKEIDQWVKLKNARKVKDGYELVPNDNDGYMGAVIAIDDDLEAAINTCIERAKMIKGEDVEFSEHAFDNIRASIEAGKKFGVSFG